MMTGFRKLCCERLGVLLVAKEGCFVVCKEKKYHDKLDRVRGYIHQSDMPSSRRFYAKLKPRTASWWDSQSESISTVHFLHFMHLKSRQDHQSSLLFRAIFFVSLHLHISHRARCQLHGSDSQERACRARECQITPRRVRQIHSSRSM